MSNNDTINISVRNVNAKAWSELSQHITCARSEFIRQVIENQITKTDSLTELKRELEEMIFEYNQMGNAIDDKKLEIAELENAQIANVDNQILQEKIMSKIKAFESQHGGITKEKINTILHEDFADSVSLKVIMDKVKEEKINIVKSMEILDSSKSYNRNERDNASSNNVTKNRVTIDDAISSYNSRINENNKDTLLKQYEILCNKHHIDFEEFKKKINI